MYSNIPFFKGLAIFFAIMAIIYGYIAIKYDYSLYGVLAIMAALGGWLMVERIEYIRQNPDTIKRRWL